MNQSQKPRQTIERYASLILGVVTCVLVFVNVFWLVQDTRPVPAGDENTIMAKTLLFVDRLKTDGFNLEMIDQLSHYGRPPLYQLLSVPFVLIFGRTMDSGVYVNMLFYVLLMVATYNIGKVAHSRPAGLLAAILVGTYPTMVRISHLYRPSFALAACTALTMWLLLLLVKTRSIKYAWSTSLSLAFGLFIHPLFAWGVPIPVALVYVYLVLTGQEGGGLTSFRELPGWLGKKLKQPTFLKGILSSGLVTVGIILLWYLTRGEWMISTMSRLTSPEVTELRGFDTLVMGFKDEYPPFLMYVLTSPRAISIVFSVLAGIGLVSAFVKRSLPGLILAGTFTISYIILSLQPTLGWRYFDEILPIAAVLTSLWIFNLRSKKLEIILVVICLGIASLNFIMTTSDLTPASNRIVNILGGISADSRDCDMAAYALFCPDPPQTEYWPVTDMLRIISEDPDCSSLSEGNNCKLLIVSINPYFQFPVFTYHLTQDFPELVLEIQGVVKTIVNVDDLLEFQYIIYQDIPSKGKGWYNKVLLDILQTKDTLFSESHQRIAELNLPDDTRAILIKRTKPLEYLEAVQVLKSIDFPDPEMYRYFEVALLPPLAINEGKTEDASLLCSEALTFSKTSTLLVVFDYMMYADLGWTHYLCGNLDAATDAYNHALGIYELDERSHYGLGLIFDAQNQIDRAHKEFELTIQCDPNSHYAFLAREWLDQNK